MKIGIDISQIAFPGTGTAVYTQNLIENLLKNDAENEYVFFYSSLRKRLPVFNHRPPVKIQIKTFKFPPTLFEIIWNRFHFLPIETFIDKTDIFHTSDWLEPPARCPKVTTIHDLVVYKNPETLHHRIVTNQKRKLDRVKKESKLIIAVSQNTKKDIVEILGIPEKRIRVVYEACSMEFFGGSLEQREMIKKKYNIQGDYILAVGTIEPRKNLRRVIEAFGKLPKSNFSKLQLVIAGKFGWGAEISNNKYQTINIKKLGYVPIGDLASLYAGAQCFVYPSLYEGFGLPVLEAMTCGCPVVTSNISSLPEIAGDAAILVNPESVKDIAGGIEKVLGNNKTRDILIQKGLARAREFSWEKTARETLAIYKEVSS